MFPEMKTTRSNIRKLYAFSFLQMTLFPMAIITIFWKDQIGLSLTQILLLQGILSLSMVVMEYPSGYISDRIGYRVSLSMASLVGMVGWGIYTVATSFTHVMLAEILIGTSLAFISGSDSALLYESLKLEGAELQYERHQGRMGGYAQGGEAIGALFAGLLYAYAPLLPFFLQIGVWFLALLLTRSMVEPPREIAPHSGHFVEALRIARYAFVENKSLRYTILLNSVLGISSFYPVWLIQPYMQHAGVPLTWFGPVWCVSNLTVAFFSLVSHRVNGLLGERLLVLLFLFLIGLGYAGLGIMGGMWGFLFYYLLTSMRGLRGPMMLNLTQKECPSANRAGILSLQSLCFRLLFICTGPLVGKLADQSGVKETFQYLLIGFLMILPPLAWLFIRNLPNGKRG